MDALYGVLLPGGPLLDGALRRQRDYTIARCGAEINPLAGRCPGSDRSVPFCVYERSFMSLGHRAALPGVRIRKAVDTAYCSAIIVLQARGASGCPAGSPHRTDPASHPHCSYSAQGAPAIGPGVQALPCSSPERTLLRPVAPSLQLDVIIVRGTSSLAVMSPSKEVI